MQLSVLFASVRLHVPVVLDDTLAEITNDVIQDYFYRARNWIVTETVTPDQIIGNVYSPVIPAGASILKVNQVNDINGAYEPASKYQIEECIARGNSGKMFHVEGDTITLAGTEDKNVSVMITYSPLDVITELPDDIYQKSQNTLKNGIISKLYALPYERQDFKLSQYYEQKYENGVIADFRAREQGKDSGKRIMSYGGY